MPDYRRVRVPGGTYFFTVAIADRKAALLIDQLQALRDAFRLRARRERGVWQRCCWEHWVRDEADFNRCLDYIHYNPIKHGYVTRAIDWPHSRV